MTVLNRRPTAGRHTANPSADPFPGNKCESTVWRIISIAKKLPHKKIVPHGRDASYWYFVEKEFKKKRKPDFGWPPSYSRSQWNRDVKGDNPGEERSPTYISVAWFSAWPAGNSLHCFRRVDRWFSRPTTHCVTRLHFRGINGRRCGPPCVAPNSSFIQPRLD